MAWLNGERSLEEQMLGLDVALAEAGGKTVLDAGCAEGLIGIEFARAGATVLGMDVSPMMVTEAARNGRKVMGFKVICASIDYPLPRDECFDIVLALAVLHKALNVEKASRVLARAAKDLMVVRLQFGSEGEVRAKHGHTRCDLLELMPEEGFTLERQVPGPRGELVQYWRRVR